LLICSGRNCRARHSATDERRRHHEPEQDGIRAGGEGGLEVVTPKPNELFIDIDGEADMKTFRENVAIFDELVMTIAGKKVMPSKSGDPARRHIIVTLSRDITDTERLLFQLMLGSDRKRELLGYVRVLNDDPTPTLFFEKAPPGE
jgi:hypothetical protein